MCGVEHNQWFAAHHLNPGRPSDRLQSFRDSRVRDRPAANSKLLNNRDCHSGILSLVVAGKIACQRSVIGGRRIYDGRVLTRCDLTDGCVSLIGKTTADDSDARLNDPCFLFGNLTEPAAENVRVVATD